MMDMWREKRKARRKNRGSQVPLQGSFLAAGFCGLAMFASYAERGPDGKPAFARVDAALSGPWARFHVDNAPPGTEEWDATLRRRLHDASPPPFAPPASPAPPASGTCGSAFKVSDDTGFPDLWQTQKTSDENLQMAFFQFFVIVVTFLGLAVICDDYFMAALEAIVDYLKLKEDVAGATFMAAGGSAPELSTSIMGVFFAESDVGIGTIIGSAVFNVLFVIACCAFVAPNLKLSWWPLARDSTYYCFGITVLVGFMVDNRIHLWEAVILLMLYFGYCTIMYFNEDLEVWVQNRVDLTKKERKPWQKNILQTFDNAFFNVLLYGIILANTGVIIAELSLPSDEKTFDNEQKSQKDIYDAMNYAFSAIFIIEMLVKWSAHGFFGYWRQPLNCFDGILVGLIVIEYAFTEMSVIANNDLRQELLDANPNMTDADAGDTQELGIVGAGRSLRILRFFRIVRTLRVFRLYRAFHKHYTDATTQVLPGDWTSTSSGMLTKQASREGQANAKVDGPPRASVAGEDSVTGGASEEEEEEGGPANPFDIPETWVGRLFWLVGLPVAISMFITIPDCRRPAFRKFWPLTFICSIVWIAILAYFMVWMTTDFGARNGVPDSIMGLTLLAAGTSIPDALSSVAVAKRGHGDMAVSSSIGSNIFDILFGLPVPWLIATMMRGIQNDGDFVKATRMPGGGGNSKDGLKRIPYVEIFSCNLIFMILLLFLMVALVITTVHLCGWRLLVKLGYMMMLFYFIFLSISLLLETGQLF
jgi:K+-dependent Na+/Ca+ exchanger-like protein